MSIISGQIDRLRSAAQTYRKMGNHSAESMLLDAADTIWELRDDLQRANAAVQDAEHDESMAWDRVRKAEAENAKLRGLVEDMHAVMVEDAANCDVTYPEQFDDRMQELGIKVGE